MSRTDVHRPGWVKERDPHMRHLFVEDHDHRHGHCDLAVFLASPGWTRTNCRLSYRGGRNIYCGCKMCTGQVWRKQAARRDRSRWRATSRALIQSAPEDRDLVDVAPVPGSGW